MTCSTQAIPTTSAMSARPREAGHGLRHLLKSWWDAYWALRAQRATVFKLRSLDDRNLHDIGLDRSEIESVVYGKLGERQLRYERNWR